MKLAIARSLLSLILLLSITVACGGGSMPKSNPPVPVTTTPTTAPTASITANPTTVQSGQSATLTWQSTNATDVSIDGIGAVQPNGTQSVTPTSSTLYTLTAKGLGGTKQGTAMVTVTAPPTPQPPTPPPVPPPPVPPPPPPVPSLPSSWTATDLPPIPGAGAAQANAINNLGHAVGYSVVEGVGHATLWESGMAIDLAGPNTFANGINDSDQIVGYRLDASFIAHAHLWPDDIDLGSLAGYDSSVATGINSSGLVVGIAFSQANPNLQTAFTWSKTAGMQAVAGCASAEAINDSGQIAGIATNLDAAICGEQDFGMQGAAGAINNAGQAVGFSPPNSNNTQAWLFPNIDLGPTLATGINDYGWVCGYSMTPIGGAAHVMRMMSVTHVARLEPHVFGTSHPWVWSQATGIVMLSGITTANAMNQSGQIVGAAIMADGSTHGMLLTGN